MESIGLGIRPLEAKRRFTDAITMEAIDRAIPMRLIDEVLEESGSREKRCRTIPARLSMLSVVAMNLFTEESIEQAFSKMIQGLRFAWMDLEYRPPTKGAICQARYRLGSAPVEKLFHRVCRPIATPQTPGAFLFGLRLMAVDGSVDELFDSAPNARVFDRQRGTRGISAFPQVQGVYLSELGTHVVCDAVFSSYATSERPGALQLLRSVSTGMLLMWDRGFHSHEMIQETLRTGAEFLGRVPACVIFKREKNLPDGSYLARVHPHQDRYKRGEGLPVRVVEYTIDDPNREGHGVVHRLATSLLDWQKCPAQVLAYEYHQRWEIELVFDEIGTHQRVRRIPLRSQKPQGVLQELYGLLLAHFAVRVFMHEAACRDNLDPDRLSFTQSLRILRCAIPEFQQACASRLAQLYTRLLDDIFRHKLPPRDNRSHPRVVKRKMSNFALKRPAHRHWPQPTKPFRASIVMLN